MTKDLPVPTTNIEQLAQAHEGEALALYVEAMRDPSVKMDVRLRAADAILDRARGKPKVQQQKDPAAKKTKAVSMSIDTLMKIAGGAVARVKHEDEQRKNAEALEAVFVPCPSPPRRPRNEHALPAPAADSVEDLLS